MADQLFFATFPAARDAAAYSPALEQSTYDLPRPVDGPPLHEATQPLEYGILIIGIIQSTSEKTHFEDIRFLLRKIESQTLVLHLN